VIGRFGPPHRESASGDWMVYSYRMQGGHWVLLPCVPLNRALQVVAVRFDFDPAGVLRAAHVEKGPPSRPSLLTSMPQPPRMLRELPPPATRPATLPAATTCPASTRAGSLPG
jgi:hypothetical protein